MTKNYQPPENNKISLYNLDEEWLEKTKQRYRLYQKKEYEQRLQQMYRKRDAWMDFLDSELELDTTLVMLDKKSQSKTQKSNNLKEE